MNLNIKAIFIAGLIMAGGVVSFGVAEKNDMFGIKSWGHKEYFVYIEEDGEKVNNNIFSYLYELEAYNEKGKKIDVEFYANKNLRKGAYLSVDTISQDREEVNSIASYKEVEESEVPNLAKEELLDK